jgi:hypothetical protein
LSGGHIRQACGCCFDVLPLLQASGGRQPEWQAGHAPAPEVRLVILLLATLIAVAAAIGIWRGFTAIEWIWTFFAIAISMMVLWLILVIFVVGPEMRRMAPFG